MSDGFHAASSGELASVGQAQAEYRALWDQMIQPPFRVSFDGRAADIRAMDYLLYEGFPDPLCGVQGAALVWGEVLRRPAGMHWVTGDRGDLMLASHLDGILIWPFARLLEVRQRSVPQFGKYHWAMEQAVVDLILCLVPDEAKHRLFHLISPEDGGYSETILEGRRLAEALREWRGTSPT